MERASRSTLRERSFPLRAMACVASWAGRRCPKATIAGLSPVVGKFYAPTIMESRPLENAPAKNVSPGTRMGSNNVTTTPQALLLAKLLSF